jgi:hypothetical protein
MLDRIDTGLLTAAIAVLLYIANVGLTLRGRRAGLAKDRKQVELTPPATGRPAELLAYLDTKIAGLTTELRALILPDVLLCALIALLLARILGEHTGPAASPALDCTIIIVALAIVVVLFAYHTLEWITSWGRSS